jgi:deoxyribodipyrimidine photolyase-like uncharacterized protein
LTKQDISQSIWITGDQCSTKNSALAAADKSIATVLMIESIARGNKLKYHKKKLVLIYSVVTLHDKCDSFLHDICVG